MKRLVLMLAIAVIAAGCASRRPGACCSPSADRDVIAGSRALKIELLGFPSCPNTPAMRESLRAALSSIGGGLTFDDVNQESLLVSDPRRGWPTPSVLVNGADLFGMAPPPPSAAPSMGCRVYPDGVPDAAGIAERLRQITRSANP